MSDPMIYAMVQTFVVGVTVTLCMVDMDVWAYSKYMSVVNLRPLYLAIINTCMMIGKVVASAIMTAIGNSISQLKLY